VTRRPDPADEKWSGPTRAYDLVKEFVVATVVVALLVVILAVLFGSPDDKAVTLQKWATVSSGDFIATAATELDGTSVTASYGAPYNRTPRSGPEARAPPAGALGRRARTCRHRQ
jgi:hypothetical protein